MEKNKLIQQIRGILIICVIIIHSISMSNDGNVNYINIIIRTLVNFTVGVFVFYVGYFIKKQEINEKNEIRKFYIKKFKRLVIPFFIWSLLYTIFHIARQDGDIKVVKEIARFFIGKNGVQLYYIVAIIQLILITPLLVKLLDKNNKIINNIILLITPIWLITNGIYNYVSGENIPLYGTYGVAWISYFYLGIMIKNDIVEIKNNKKCLIYAGLFFLVGVFINCIEYNLGFNFKYVTSQVKLSNYFYIISIIYVFATLNRYYCSILNSNTLLVLGNNSFGIYFIHIFPLEIIKSTMNRFDILSSYEIFRSWLVAILTIICSMVGIYLIKIITKNKLNKYLGF